MKKLYYYFKMLRIEDWIKSSFWAPLIGAFLVHALWKDFFLVAVIYFCATGYGFAVNNYFDVKIDKKHKGKIQSNKNPLAQDLVTKRGTKMLLGALIIIPLIFAVQMNFIGFIFVLLSIFCSTLYSARHIRLKEKPGLDLISYGLGFSLFPFLAGVTLVGGNINFPFLLIGFLIAVLGNMGIIIHQIVDYQDDLGNTNNTVIAIGPKLGYVSLILLAVISLLCFKEILKYFTFEWWFFYSLVVFLAVWIPLRFYKGI